MHGENLDSVQRPIEVAVPQKFKSTTGEDNLGKRKQGKRRLGTCVYCSATGEVTRDHPFPRTLFKVRDPSMITVDSCDPCNQKKSKGDRDLRNYITMHIGGSLHPDAAYHVDKMVSSGPKMRDWLANTLRDAQPVPMVTAAGLIIDYGLKVDFNKIPMFDSLAMAVRGLHFDKFGTILPSNCPVEVVEVPFSYFFEYMRKLGSRMQSAPTQKGNFVVWWSHYSTESGNLQDSLWVLCFNDGLAFQVATGEAARIQQRVDSQLEADSKRNEARRRLVARLGPDPIKAPPEYYLRTKRE